MAPRVDLMRASGFQWSYPSRGKSVVIRTKLRDRFSRESKAIRRIGIAPLWVTSATSERSMPVAFYSFRVIMSDFRRAHCLSQYLVLFIEGEAYGAYHA